MRTQRAFRWATDALLVLAILGAGGLWQTRRHLGGGERPEAVFGSLEGPAVPLSSLRGKPALIAFWAPWCAVCKVESQNLSWAMRLAGQRAQVVSAAAAFEDPAQVRAYVREQGVDYPVLLADEATTRAFRVEAFPTVYFLDAEGRVRRSAVGYTTTLGLLARLFL